MAKNIVILSDGTGNSSAKLLKTNVWRLYDALDLRDSNVQIAVYDDGVGTSSFKPLTILGGVFGFGLKRNVLQLYQFVCRNYWKSGPDEDRIFAFGFSRGAFTVRILAGLIASQGLLKYYGDEARLDRESKAAYREYRKRFWVGIDLLRPVRVLRDKLITQWWSVCGYPSYVPKQIDPDWIHFVGVWDTVSAYGGPIEEITRGVDQLIWPLSVPDRFMSHKIRRGCQALALDDERYSFFPVLWDEAQVSGPHGPQAMKVGWAPPTDPGLPAIDQERLSQVWFTGMHSDVGGGYAQDGLAYDSLEWMMDRAAVYGLKIDCTEKARLNAKADPYGKLNDSRSGVGAYYRYKPRRVADFYAADPIKSSFFGDIRHVLSTVGAWGPEPRRMLPVGAIQPPMIYESVIRRIVGGSDGYAPIVLPAVHRVATKAGAIGPSPFAASSAALANGQEALWNWVWGRRVVYFATLFCSLVLATTPLINTKWPGLGPESPFEFLIPLVEAAGRFLPGLASPWIDAFRQAPERLAILGITIIALLLASRAIQGRIGDKMRAMWHGAIHAGPGGIAPIPPPTGLLYRVRTSQLYRGFFYAMSYRILPIVFGSIIWLVLLYVGGVAASRALFAIGDVTGLICRASDGMSAIVGPSGAVAFDTRNLCTATKLSVTRGTTYRVTFKVTDQWEDGHRYGEPDPAKAKGIETDPNGFGQNRARWVMTLGLPFRRLVDTNWFQAVARVGGAGFEEHPLSFELTPGASAYGDGAGTQQSYSAEFTARSDGEVFLFVNDSVLGAPWIANLFYRNNKGTAEVTIEPLR